MFKLDNLCGKAISETYFYLKQYFYVLKHANIAVTYFVTSLNLQRSLISTEICQTCRLNQTT